MRAVMFTLFITATASAGVKTEVIKYKVGDTECVGQLFYDDAAKDKRPGVLVFHEWWGLNDDAKKRAEMLAKEGYVAFCADMYGDGKVTEHPADAGKFAGEVRKNEEVWLARSTEAMKVLQARKEVDGKKIAAIGYCFGGTTAIKLAFSGADVKAVAAFHAGLPEVKVEDAKKAKGKILVCHGGADTFIPEEKVNAFKKTLDEAKTNYEFISYPGVTHSFTVVGVEKKMPQLKYDADADKKSWASMLALFNETLK